MTTHTFASGVTVELGPLDRYQVARFRAALDAKYPKPAPPINHTDLGDLPNPDDPAYEIDLAVWQGQQEHRLNLVIFRFCITPPADLAEQVAKVRAADAQAKALLEEMGLPADAPTGYEEGFQEFDKDDLLFYLYTVARGGDDGWKGLIDAIGEHLTSKEVAIEAATEMFQRPV